jgi:Uma2 family endonuclease
MSLGINREVTEDSTMIQPEETDISPNAYFEMEEQAETKSEYFHGEIFAMTGASVRHNLIASNLIADLNNRLREKDCYVFPGDIKLQVDADRHYTYPNVSVVCGDIEYAENREDVIANPIAIFEILSKSTSDHDLGSKFKAYRNIPSLRDYVVIDQYSVFVTHFHKNEAGQWTLEDFEGLKKVIPIRSLDLEIDPREIYRRIEFD